METVETVTDFIFGCSKITADSDCNHKIKRYLLLGTKAMTNIDRIFKSKDISSWTNVRIVKAMFFPVVMCGCESWNIRKAEHWRIDAFELLCKMQEMVKDREAWCVAVHGVTKSRIWHKDWTTNVHRSFLDSVCVWCACAQWSHGLQPSRLFCLWNFPGKNTGVGCHPFPTLGDLPNPGIEPMSLECLLWQADSLPLCLLWRP